MKKLIIVTCMIILASCSAMKQKSLPQEESQDQLILATLWYQRSAEMRAIYYQCFRNAETALSENLSQQGRTKPAAVVLDIDETVLDNSPYQGWQVLENRSFNNQDWIRWVELAQAAPLPGAVEFTRYADSLGVEVFYVSNRAVAEMGPTIRNMSALGFADADSTHMLLKKNTSSKVERRAVIEKDYEIVLLVGDNLADHNVTYEKRADDYGFAAIDADRKLFGTKYIVLPNPMYGNWLNELLKSSEGDTSREKLLKLLETF
jgi:5'-nucleotidase (lipoprotein e(P4) family)